MVLAPLVALFMVILMYFLLAASYHRRDIPGTDSDVPQGHICRSLRPKVVGEPHCSLRGGPRKILPHAAHGLALKASLSPWTWSQYPLVCEGALDSDITLLYYSTTLDSSLLKVSLRNRQLYALRHGYRLCRGAALLDPSRHPSFNKLLVMHSLLGLGKWLVYMDADSLIMRLEDRLEDRIPELAPGAADSPDFIFVAGPTVRRGGTPNLKHSNRTVTTSTLIARNG